MRISAIVFVTGLLALSGPACTEKKDAKTENTPSSEKKSEAVSEPVAALGSRRASGPAKSLLLTESRFKADDKGAYTVPDVAVLTILSPSTGGAFGSERIEDRESNVFHKALKYGKDGILTIGGNAALLKLWKKDKDAWTAQTLWSPVFGGKQNRLRDFEIADIDKDGFDDLAIATHDQGVVAVVWRRGAEWKAEEIDRQKDTFVHEIEVGDLDGNGALEIYATPSQPNTLSGKAQGGKIVGYQWKDGKFEKREVVSLQTRHVKEIMVKDVDKDGKQELYAAFEAEMDGNAIRQPVEIARFDWENGAFKKTTVASIDDRYCRFLAAGDLDSDGENEIVAAAFSSGVWLLKREGASYKMTNIDPKSGGFEHAAFVADLDSDGKSELYVANDKNGAISQFTFADGRFQSRIVNRRIVPSSAMVWNITDCVL